MAAENLGWRCLFTVVLALLLAVGITGCGGDGGQEVAAPDGVADFGRPEELRAEDGPLPQDARQPEPDLLDSVFPEPDEAAEPDELAGESDLGPPPPVAEPVEPEPVVVETWLVSYAKDSNSDPVGDALDKGTFVMPAGPGKGADGVEWLERKATEGGKLGFAGYGLFYAAAVVNLEADQGIIVRADRFYRVWVNGSVQPGDPYMSRKHRTPAAGRKGENIVVAMAYAAVKDPEIELWRTPAELYFNPLDLTLPVLVEGAQLPQPVGVPVLNLTGWPLAGATARVVGSDLLEETTLTYPSLGPEALTQIGFLLQPKQPWPASDEGIPAQLRIESHSLQWSYESSVMVPVTAAGKTYRHTRISQVDRSVQFAGINPPADFDPGEEYSLVLSLHGAGVDGLGQAGAYSQKDWAFLVAPTNRRPFGFDWEEWGRLDGLEALEEALTVFPIDPTAVFVTGHSMGGHGTWQFGALFPGRFALVGPSAGWSSFYSYGGSAKPTGPFARARASSDTLNYIANFNAQAVYMIHGDADDNVPISEGNLMAAAVEPVAAEFHFHVQPGAGHWWDGDASPGADCVDWPELFEWMAARRLELTPLDFSFVTPSPWVNAVHSYVTIRSQADPFKDSTLSSKDEGGGKVKLTTGNVRSLVLDGTALGQAGVTQVVVDGATVAVAAGPLPVGPQEGKNQQTQGPFNQVFHRPFCFVYPDDDPVNPDPHAVAGRRYASYLLSAWNIIGNGHGCALPLSGVTPAIRKGYNLIYIGLAREQVPLPPGISFDWNDEAVVINQVSLPGACLVFVFPEQGHLSAAMVTAKGYEHLLFWHQPFSSRSGLPDYVSWGEKGAVAAGFFTPEWDYDPKLGVGP